MSLAIEGAFFYAPSPYSLTLCPHGLILVDDDGIIEFVHTLDDEDFFKQFVTLHTKKSMPKAAAA